MEDLLDEAAKLWRSVSRPDELRLIGGLGVRTYVGARARLTHDIDIVAMTDEACAEILAALDATGAKVAQPSVWWRAVRRGPPRCIVDVIRNPVVDMRAFDPVSLGSDSRVAKGAEPVRVATPEDLVRMKLVSHRDQDLVDVALLTSVEVCAPLSIVQAAERDDGERALARGAIRCRAALDDGQLHNAFEELLGQPPSDADLMQLRELLAALEKEGI